MNKLKLKVVKNDTKEEGQTLLDFPYSFDIESGEPPLIQAKTSSVPSKATESRDGSGEDEQHLQCPF